VFRELANFIGDDRETTAGIARARASIAAFKANRLVCSVMSLMTLMILKFPANGRPAI